MLQKKVGISLSYLMQFLIFVYAILSFYKKDYSYALMSAIYLFVSFIPAIMKRKWSITLPWTLNFLIMLSLYLHIAGTFYGWYRIFHPFYDKFGHFITSATVALIGFASVRIMERYSKIKINKNHIIFFIIIFTVAIGVFWEIIEFLFDTFLGTQAQYDGLTGTMLDLIFNFLGGIAAALYAYVRFETLKNKFANFS